MSNKGETRMMLTEFGKYCRILRINNGEILNDMAKKLGVTASYLSAIENGKRDITDGIVTAIEEKYGLKGDDLERFNEAVASSKTRLSINIKEMTNSNKEVMLALAKKIDSPSSKEEVNEILAKISTILKRMEE